MVDIVIIGAGAAGLAAAAECLAAGKKVLVLEARNRTGGRIWTSRAHGGVVEYGAEFVHGSRHASGNFLAKHAIKSVPWQPTPSAAYGNQLYSAELVKLLQSLNDSFWNALLDYAGPDMPLSEFIDGHFLGSAGKVLLAEMIRDTEGADPSRISTAQLRDAMSDANDDLAGEAAIPVGGYKKFIQLLSMGVAIKTKMQVTRLDFSKKNVTVYCADGSKLSAKQCICTVPLGVLQSGDIVFTPELPISTLNAMQAIGMGTSVKLQLWFKKDPLQIQNLHTDQMVGNWWKPLHQPKDGVLYSGLVGGAPAQYIASLPVESALLACVNDLASLFGKSVQDSYIEGVLSNWIADPFTKGSYSFNTVGLTDERETLGSPQFDGRLIFAGEAIPTSRWNYGTVHGAMESGKLAAVQILHRIGK
jgi:monoamine oxidase